MSTLLQEPAKTQSSGTKVPPKAQRKINLCCGPIRLPGYINIDIVPDADVVLDLEKELLPFPDESVDTLVCISAINYFSRQRGLEILKEVYRVLAPNGVARFAVQDLRVLASKYLNQDRVFYFEKLQDGRDRFPGKTFAEKFNEFFQGFQSCGKFCKFVYDFETLALAFREAGFGIVEQKEFRQSRIAHVEMIDNRPEQMFFLEAIKTGKAPAAAISAALPRTSQNNAALREKAQRIWDQGEKERAWQLWLKILELDPADRPTLDQVARVLKEQKRFEEEEKLYHAFLASKPGDAEISAALVELGQRRAANRRDESMLLKRRQELNSLDLRVNRVLSDEEHLAACMKWLNAAHMATNYRGVSAYYLLQTHGWDVAYPETTGYITATFVRYAQLTGNKTHLQSAIQMADWEMEIQSPEGGAGEPVGVYGLRPRVFNTSQVMYGWLALYRHTKDSKYLEAARKAGDWIVKIQNPDGNWNQNTYRGPKAYKIRVAWALLELFAETQDAKYRTAAERTIAWVMNQALPNGWFANTSLSDPGKPWTHLIGYTLVGLQQICRLKDVECDRRRISKLLTVAAGSICRFYDLKVQEGNAPLYGLPATFDANWQSSDAWSCLTGDAQLAFFLHGIGRETNNANFVRVADAIVADLKKRHLMDGIDDPNVHGAIAGCYPISADYCGYSIPNWGVKFFADALLQKISPDLAPLLG